MPPSTIRPSRCSARPRRQLRDGVGLLEDLLEHVMLVVAQLVLLELVFELADDRADVDVVDGRGAELVGLQHRHLVVVEVDDLRGVLDDGAGVGGDDVFVLARRR